MTRRFTEYATAPLRPGTAIGVTVTYTANFATDDADVFVTLPEVEAATQSGWDDRYEKPLGTERPVKAESNQGFAAGGRVTHSFSFSVPAAGVYRVHATARSNKAAPDETADRTQQSAYKSLWLLVDKSGGQAGEDGSIDEGVVAAFFHDLIDPAGETGDRIDLTGTDVSRVMNTCQVYFTAWNRPRGIDDLIWCLEAEVDAGITGDADYFPTRTNDATRENQSNHSWNEDHVRTLWLKDLYGENGS